MRAQSRRGIRADKVKEFYENRRHEFVWYQTLPVSQVASKLQSW